MIATTEPQSPPSTRTSIPRTIGRRVALGLGIVLILSKQASLILGVLALRDPNLANNKRLQSAQRRLAHISQSNALLPLIDALHRVRVLEILAPIGAALCFALSILLAVNRRRGLRNVGLSIAIPA